jgi:hypothetical protein
MARIAGFLSGNPITEEDINIGQFARHLVSDLSSFAG